MTVFKLILSTLFVSTLLFDTSYGQTKSQPIKSKADMQKVEVQILSLLTVSDTADEYCLTLGAKSDTLQKLTMIIGKNEAQTLAITLENLQPTAPLPLDLFQDAIIKFGYNVQEVLIDSLINEIYTSKIICTGKSKVIELKARPTDVVTIALKFNCPIFVDKKLLHQ